MSELTYGVIGCGFWSQFQIAAWREVGGVHLGAVYNRTRSKAAALARRFGDPRVYDSVGELLEGQKLDFVDIITSVETHAEYTCLAAKHGVPVICQKPMAPTMAECQQMVETCEAANVPLFIHDNWRWQAPIRALKARLDSGRIGMPFRARFTYSNSFPVFANQPFLKELEQFIIMDMGTHVLDTVRLLLGSASSVYCQTASVTPDIKGEDVATIELRMKSGVHCTVELSYASHVEHDCFPELFIMIEGTQGSLELAPGCWVRETAEGTTTAERISPPMYPWADPAYALVHSSIVDANRNFLHALQGIAPAETTGKDYLKTMAIVFKAYESAHRNAVVKV